MSIKLENVVPASPEQMEFIIEGMRNPMNSWEKSDSGFCGGDEHIGCDHCSIAGSEEHNKEMFKTDLQYGYGIKPCGMKDFDGRYCVGHNDHSLMRRLSNAGTEHRKYMRMMPVYVRITAPLYWWKEFDTYKIGTVANSCSTMHKIAEKEFVLDDFSHEHLDAFVPENEKHIIIEGGKFISLNTEGHLRMVVHHLNFNREKYLETKDKRFWWQMIQLLPSSYNQTRNVMLNYEVLANIYRQRKNHKLDEWREFCKWIRTLPYSELITGLPIVSDQSIEEKRFTQPFPWIKEDDVYCNNCEHFHDCLNKGGLADVTTSDDIVKNGFGQQHYINKPGYDCPKEKEQ